MTFSAVQKTLSGIFGLFILTGSAIAATDYQSTLDAAEKGDAAAQKRLGDMYYQGENAEGNPVTALYWYEKAGEQGDLSSQIMAGDIYHLGTGVSRNDWSAKKWYERAADQGNARAQFSLGTLYLDGGYLFPKNKNAAKIWLTEACKNGSMPACHRKKETE